VSNAPYVVTDAELADLIERCEVDAASYARQAESSPAPHVEEEWARVARLERDALRELQALREQVRWRPMEPEDQFPSGANVTDNTGCDV
jgi:hypothetical protein